MMGALDPFILFVMATHDGILGSVDYFFDQIKDSGWFNSAYQNQLAAQDFNAEQSQLDRDFQERMWNQSNAYNTPAAQMERLKAAGLNPNLVYGQPISEAAAPAGAEASISPARGMVATDVAAQAMDAVLLGAQKRNIEADTSKKDSETSVNQKMVTQIEATTDKLREEARKFGLENSITEQTMPSEVAAAIAKNNLTESEAKAAAKFVERTAQAQYNKLVEELNTLKKRNLINDKELAIAQEKLKQEMNKTALSDYERANMKTAFWLGKINDMWDVAVLMYTKVDDVLKGALTNAWKTYKNNPRVGEPGYVGSLPL